MSRSKIEILKDAFSYSGATFIVQNITFFLAIFVRRELGPEAIGIWTVSQLFLGYASYAGLGIYDAICREIPILRGRQDEKGLGRLKRVALTFTLISSAAGGLIILAAAFIFRANMSELMFQGLLWMSAINVLQKTANLFLGFLSAEKQFRLLGKFKVYSAVMNAIFVGTLVWAIGLQGYYVAMFLSFVYNALYLVWRGRLDLGIAWDSKETARLIRFGAPFIALGFASTLFGSIDKIAVGKFLGLKELGIYSIATMAGGYLIILPNILQQVLLPRILERFGEGHGAKGFANLSTMPSKIVAVYFSLIIGLLWLGAPWLCITWLPKFVGGIPSLKALLFAYAFSALSVQIYPMLLGHLRHLWSLPLCLVFSLCIYGLSGLIVHSGGGLTLIAWMTAGFYLLNYLVVSSFALKPHYSAGGVAGLISSNLIPLFWALGVLLVFDRVGVAVTFWRVVGQALLYTAVWLGCIFLMEKKLGIFKMTKETYLSWISSKRAVTA